jgi:hypothetical protein
MIGGLIVKSALCVRVRLDVVRRVAPIRAIKHREAHDDHCRENGKDYEQPYRRCWNTA